ncbi:unnamed protein product [Lepeophtheirus salmonis]|uniref:Sex-determining region Y protein n=1 Tax=Lepeophtheirus salmonis TaxID=72036 RepID=A0A7R8CMA6_LEPSM|nr:unnamed protein product [Lepeophtheirus salmonis]CAF2865114.1 unnamed protein product [Lepeophtheirus salmonis]
MPGGPLAPKKSCVEGKEPEMCDSGADCSMRDVEKTEDRSVFSSQVLDSALCDKDLRTSYVVPQSAAAQCISEKTTGMPLPQDEILPTDVGLNLGLGIKRKMEMSEQHDDLNMPGAKRSKKPKTLSEKRVKLEEDIRKPPTSSVKRKRGPKSGIKMKPKPYGLDFKEIDAQLILRPFSHDKYIQQPEYNSVVYINRRKGMVPLSSLGKDCQSVLSKHGRVIAIGGSRNKENDSLKVIPVPDIKSRLARSQSSLDFIPFYMDEEFTSFAVGAIYSPKKKPKIDIRTWKKMKKNESDKVDLKEVLRKKSIVDHVYDKMLQSVPKKTEEENDPTTTTSEDEENERENTTTKSANESCKIFNKLLDSTSSFVNPLPDPEGCPVTSAEFRTALKERNTTDGTRTPESNIPTPIENKDQHVVKNLKKVKRALKTLGVNLVEFDVTNGIRKDCDKDFCRLGCICETLSGSPVVPNHCCKIECMFRCHCSEETLKKLSSSRKVAISPSAYTNFQDKSPPNVVTTDALTLESASQDFMSKSEDVFNLDTILVPGKENPNIVKMISNGIRDGVSRKCTVLVPKINLSNLDISVKPWCMYHCRHSCPCFKFENPLDYAPDLSKSRKHDEEKDNDDNVEKETSNKNYKVRKDQCARTEGMCINPSYKLKMPHKFVTVKESAEAEIKGDVISFKLPHDDKKTVIDLTLKPSKAVQYINCSGIAWEITGILQKKGDKTTTPLNNKSIKEPSVVNLELSNQRLDPGQNLVTVSLSGRNLFLVLKLPYHFKTIIIKQAADLANSENTTVRIPIEATSVVKEVKEFETSSEIDCGLKEEEEDITIIPTIQTPTSNSGCRRKQKLTTKYDEIDRINNEKIITSLVELVADTAVVFGERRKKRRRFFHRPIMGSVPSVVSKEKTIEEISVIEEEKNGSKLQSDILKETSTNNEIPNYRNLPNSDYGIIKILKCFKNSIGSDRVQFYHPSFPKHIVMCKDVINARKWMEEYITLAERHSSPLLQPSILKSRLMRCRRKVKKEALTEEQRQEYIQLFYKLRRSMLPEHDASLMYNRVQVIDYATILIQDLKKKVQDQEKVKKELLTLRSGLFDEFTSKLKGLPIDLKKEQPASLKPPPVAIIQRSFTNKKVSNAMPDLIPIHGDIEGPSKSAATTKTLPPTEEKKNRKPLNAFMLWAKKQRPKFVSSGLSTGELSRMLVDKWHQLSQKERQQYQIEAARLKKLNSNMESSDTTDKELLCSEKKKVVEEQDDNSIIVLDEKPSKKISPPIIEISLD